MIFKKKSSKDKIKCLRCKSSISSKHSFCPECGLRLASLENEEKEFGMLGKYDFDDSQARPNQQDATEFGIVDKIINSAMNTLMKTIAGELEKGGMNARPNGIKIKIGVPQRKKQSATQHVKAMNEEQLKKMIGLPRTAAKTNVRRLSDKVIYELTTPGLLSPHDVLVSKLESGYEVKAITDKKVYVNSLPVNLPLRGVSLSNDKLFIEFKIQDEFE